jgi:V/A-type H+-transporting ATPase subunit D
MAELRRVPPGRAGRLWLAARLHTAQLASDLLDRKLRVLRQERERFGLIEDRARSRWQSTWRIADAWTLRAAVVAGSRDLRLSAPAQPASVEVAWKTVMGVRYPAEISCSLPPLGIADRSPGSAALIEARTALAEAVEAAAAYAAAVTARRVIDGEIEETRRRLRAITDRWVPRLDDALRRLTQNLEEIEREETFRRIRAAPATTQVANDLD